MSKLPPTSISILAKLAGFTGANLDVATAIAMAESGGETTAHNTKGQDNSYGLWQINMYGALGPSRRQKYGLKNNDELFNPSTNARVAHRIFVESGFGAWTTYTSGEYKKHMGGGLNDKGAQLGDTIPDNAKVDADQVAENVLPDLRTAIASVGNNIFKGVSNLVGVVFAIALLVLGVVILLRNQIPTGKAIKIAKKVIA